MAKNKMNDSVRGVHVSPGIYSRETELTYAVKSLGITTLGLAGETLRGPAFQPMAVENWREFTELFGGTSTEKFKGTQYPKYELPYIAKSYLSESNQLQVCRVLGLSGYNAGPAWAITASGKGNGENMVVAVLRARGQYVPFKDYGDVSGKSQCECPTREYDVLEYQVGEKVKVASDCNKPKTYNKEAVTLTSYTSFFSNGNECEGYTLSGKTEDSTNEIVSYVNSSNLGKFTIVCQTGMYDTEKDAYENSTKLYYAVSFNPADKDYILKVLGTNPTDGTSPIYVETLYDVALKQLVSNQGDNTGDYIDGINKELSFYDAANKADYCGIEPVATFATKAESELTRRDVGMRVLVTEKFQPMCHVINLDTNDWAVDGSGVIKTASAQIGQILTVRQHTDKNGKREYWYAGCDIETVKKEANVDYLSLDALATLEDKDYKNYHKAILVKNLSDNCYYRNLSGTVTLVDCDLNDYRSSYRFASTPWFVSNIKGDFNNMELNRLFRFHTISDGNNSHKEIKISIENVRPNEGMFDVVIRDINDSDTMIVPLEKYSKCTMVPGDANYIGYKIGSYDGIYEAKSKYVTVEVNEDLTAQNSVPCGFLGYPTPNYGGTLVYDVNELKCKSPYLKYNVNYDQEIKNKRQYFGLSDIVGVDVDMFNFQGKDAYIESPIYTTKGFHLDSRLSNLVEGQSITVDGEKGYEFNTVSINNRTKLQTEAPIIGKEEDMVGCIYEDLSLRKFTAYFYGGFDGWDIYRDARTNTDEYKKSKYMGQFDNKSGEGAIFNTLAGNNSLGIGNDSLTTDWYAYLAAIRQFANPEEVDINMIATPGIDIINNTSLVQEVIEMVEEERADSIYIATLPDKPLGASDHIDDMYTPEDIVSLLEDTDIDSNYTCVYYPWVKHHDVINNQYIYLPPTKDVVRNMALTDNSSYPWFAPAGLSRGDVDCVRAKYVTKLADEDVLYAGRVNPIKTFASDGVKIWGQKNLQIRESQLNRIATRRLLLRMRKLISIACIGLIFDPNDVTTKAKFLSTVTPIMDNIRGNRGISDYRIEVNDSVEARERRELPCTIYFKPYNTLEYITLNFVVTPEAVSFDAI